MTQNQIRYAELKEKNRSNLVNEDLATRKYFVDLGSLEVARQNALTNARNADTNAQSVLVAARNAETNAMNAATNAAAQAESVRHNEAMEAETRRNNDLLYSSSIYTTDSKTVTEKRGQDINKQVSLRGQDRSTVNTLINFMGGIAGGALKLAFAAG